MNESRLPDYLGHIRQAASDACSFVEGQRGFSCRQAHPTSQTGQVTCYCPGQLICYCHAGETALAKRSVRGYALPLNAGGLNRYQEEGANG